MSGSAVPIAPRPERYAHDLTTAPGHLARSFSLVPRSSMTKPYRRVHALSQVLGCGSLPSSPPSSSPRRSSPGSTATNSPRPSSTTTAPGATTARRSTTGTSPRPFPIRCMSYLLGGAHGLSNHSPNKPWGHKLVSCSKRGAPASRGRGRGDPSPPLRAPARDPRRRGDRVGGRGESGSGAADSARQSVSVGLEAPLGD